MTSLPGRWLKFHRGEQHLKRLDREVEAFVAPGKRDPIDITQNFDRDHQEWVCTIISVPECPPHWGLLAGEAIHNLRGALDHLVWDLSILYCNREPLDPKDRPWRTQFPICRKASDWKGSDIQKMVKHINPTHSARIEQLQPYHGWDGPRAHPLLSLNDLSNTDKHRVLRFVTLVPSNWRATIRLETVRHCEVVGESGASHIPGRPLETGTELLRFPLRVTGPNPHVDVDFDLSVYMGLFDRTPIRETLAQIVNFVRHTLSLFESDCTTPAALALREQIEKSRWEPPLKIPMERS